MAFFSVSPATSNHTIRAVLSVILIFWFVLALGFIAKIQHDLDTRINQGLTHIEELAQLPRGEYLKPAMLGYQHLGADVLWLRLLQVLGKKKKYYRRI